MFTGLTPEYGRFFLGPNAAVVPKPTDEANRCNLRHVTPKTLQKALYVGFSQTGQPLQVVYFGWSQFAIPGVHLAGQAGPIYLKNAIEPTQRRKGAKTQLYWFARSPDQ